MSAGPTDRTLRWGVMGTAAIARHHVVPAMLAAQHCAVVGIASRSAGTAQEFAAHFELPRAYGSYEDLLEDPDIDAVYVPLPNHLHEPWISNALIAGKHVLCEKPITLDAASAQRVVALSDQRGLILREAFMYRFHPMWELVRERIEQGAIGALTAIDVQFSFRSVDADDYRRVPEFGGGALLDLGCYAVHVARSFFGDDPLEVHAAVRPDPRSGVDLGLSCILDYGDRQATFSCAIDAEPEHRVTFRGRRGWLRIDDPFNCGPLDTASIHIGTGGDKHPSHSSVEIVEVPAASQYQLQAEAFARLVLFGTPFPSDATDATGNMQLLDRIAASAGPPTKARR